MDARIERRVRTLGRFHRQRAGHQCGLEHGFDLEQAGQRIGGGELGAVEQGQTFLCAQINRLQAGTRQCVGCGQAFVTDVGFAHAQHHAGQVRKRCQIAGSTHRALCRHHGQYALDQHRFEQQQGFLANARCALRQADQLQRHHQPHHAGRHRFAHASSVREHDIALQGGQVFALDAHAGQLAEAGVDAIHRRTLGDDGGDCSSTGAHYRQRGRIQCKRCTAIDLPPLGESDMAGAKNQGVAHVLLQEAGRSGCPRTTRACSGLNPMR